MMTRISRMKGMKRARRQRQRQSQSRERGHKGDMSTRSRRMRTRRRARKAECRSRTKMPLTDLATGPVAALLKFLVKLLVSAPYVDLWRCTLSCCSLCLELLLSLSSLSSSCLAAPVSSYSLAVAALLKVFEPCPPPLVAPPPLSDLPPLPQVFEPFLLRSFEPRLTFKGSCAATLKVPYAHSLSKGVAPHVTS
eukprot:15408_4